jgi:hypothetical protein
MLPNSPSEQFEEEHLQQALFVELLHLAPEGAELFITNDSWDKLPALLGSRMRIVRENNYEDWIVALTPECRIFLGQQALHQNIHLTFVHFVIHANQRDLFTSYDRMVSIELDPHFPAYERLAKSYASILMV